MKDSPARNTLLRDLGPTETVRALYCTCNHIQEVAEGPLRRMSRAGEVLMFLVVVGTQTIRGSRI